MGEALRQEPEILEKLSAFLLHPAALPSSFFNDSGMAGLDADPADVVAEIQAFLEPA